MRPKPIPRPAQGETDMFRNRLDNMIDIRHEFVRLTKLIDWKRFDEAFGDLYAEKGRPGLPTRLMVGLHLLKHVCARAARGRQGDPRPRSQTGDALPAQDADLGRPAGSRYRTQDRRAA